MLKYLHIQSKENFMIEKSYVMVKPEFANHPEVINEVKNQLLTKAKNKLTILKAEYIRYTAEDAKKMIAAGATRIGASSDQFPKRRR